MTVALSTITCGQPLSSTRANGFVISDVTYGAADIYPRHAHDRAYLMLVCAGGFSENASRQNAELTSGGVIVVPGGHPHHDVIATTGARGLLVTLESSFAALPREWAAHQGGAVSRAMIALHRAYRDGGLAEALAIEEHLLDAIDNVQHAPYREMRAVGIARDAIEAHSDRPLRFDALARLAGVTPAHLARAFKRATGRTMGAFLRSVRARRAAAMLGSSDDELAQVAMATGFADQSHLCRVFKAEYGVSPRRYRDQMRSRNQR